MNELTQNLRFLHLSVKISVPKFNLEYRSIDLVTFTTSFVGLFSGIQNSGRSADIRRATARHEWYVNRGGPGIITSGGHDYLRPISVRQGIDS